MIDMESTGGADASVGMIEDYRHMTDEYGKVKAVKAAIDYAKGKKECAEAFKAADLTPIGDQISSLTIVTQAMFTEPLYDKNWAGELGVGADMRAEFKKNPNTRDLSTIGTYPYLDKKDFTVQDSGKRFIGVTNAAFNGEEHLSVTIIHSLIHTGGGARVDSTSWSDVFWGNIKTHDLKHLGKKYEDILKECTRERGSNLL